MFCSLLLSALILLISLSSVNQVVAAQGTGSPHNKNNTDAQILTELTEIRKSVKEQTPFSYSSIIGSLISTGIPISAAIGLFWLEQYLATRDRISRSRNTLREELKELKNTLLAEGNRIRLYIIERQQNVDYRDIYLIIDAYYSMLYSGLFTHLSQDAQTLLSALYDGIKRHNDFVSSIHKLEYDIMINERSAGISERINGLILDYKLALTQLEIEIISMIYRSETIDL